MTLTSSISLLIRRTCLFGLPLALAACNVADSYRIVPLASGTVEASPGQPACASTAGSYALSYTTWSFKINQYPNEPPFISGLAPNVRPDSHFVYCLDYLANAFSDDQLSIGYDMTTQQTTKASGVLNYVASFAVDQSSIVIRRLIRSIFVVLSRDPSFSVRFGQTVPIEAPVTLHSFDEDPLDAEKMAGVNASIKDDGFCLVLRDFSFDDRRTGVQSYCNSPVSTVAAYPSPALSALRAQRWLRDHPERGGILYRPRLPYALEVYTKDDPSGPESWSLRQTKTVMLENLSPVVSLGIDRALFAQSHVGLEFDQGVLTNFCIARSSTISGLVDIPLDIVYGIVSLPSRTIVAEINRVQASQELVAAQTDLIVAQKQFIEFEKNKGGAKPAQADDAIINGEKTGCPDGTCTFPQIAAAVPDPNLNFSVCTKINSSRGKP
ncbi:hypothetical protein ELH33_32955 (plasmid) [Rhizobium ruizarguesonis]|uniref:hypothetical protein n=1 Tax=Rhizobium ruizarguesonis TaxID=2081791 RepID=UPI00103036F2|nr:hypothetical protein [Rhizobium ruizarguesonis]TBC25589.1 hypothetical protein ELH33_32955 [Rhizobium ruizarguesonis]